MTKLIIVDKNDQFLGFKDKEACHKVEGILHRAYSIFIFNNKDELLLQQRSKKKILWPLFWSNTCCSHPIQVTNLIGQARKRLVEEFGFSTKLKFIYKFIYHSVYKNFGSETEMCYVLVGKFNGKLKSNLNEVADYKWVNLDWLKEDVQKHPDIYTPWFKLEIKELLPKVSFSGGKIF